MAKQVRKKSVYCIGGWWVAEVYTDDDEGSGFGDNSMIGYWYGTREECVRVDPDTVKLCPVRGGSEEIDEFDLACERRWD